MKLLRKNQHPLKKIQFLIPQYDLLIRLKFSESIISMELVYKQLYRRFNTNCNNMILDLVL